MRDTNNKSGKTFRKTWRGGEGESVEVVSGEFAHIVPVVATPIEVKVFGNDKNSFERAFRAFRALVQKEKVLSLYKEKQRFEKSSDKKRRKRNESKRKRMEGSRPALKKERKAREEVKEEKTEE